MVRSKLRDDADERPYFFLEPIDGIEIYSRRHCLLCHPERAS
jgi:cbb3-type cytochrome oxidase cytochrome c subunit